jgi:hypothetical protein
LNRFLGSSTNPHEQIPPVIREPGQLQPFRIRVHSYYNRDSSGIFNKDLECGDLSPLWLPGRLVGQAEPRSAARSTPTRWPVRWRQVACRKRRELAALQSAVVAAPAALGPFVSIRVHSWLELRVRPSDFRFPGPTVSQKSENPLKGFLSPGASINEGPLGRLVYLRHSN